MKTDRKEEERMGGGGGGGGGGEVPVANDSFVGRDSLVGRRQTEIPCAIRTRV